MAVLFYHANQPWALGGFLGVETFFVLSGFLITLLLLTEWQATHRIDLKQFWLRRAHRLRRAYVNKRGISISSPPSRQLCLHATRPSASRTSSRPTRRAGSQAASIASVTPAPNAVSVTRSGSRVSGKFRFSCRKGPTRPLFASHASQPLRAFRTAGAPCHPAPPPPAGPPCHPAPRPPAGVPCHPPADPGAPLQRGEDLV